jgi:tRNA threonylcarbamoyladenosine biosynthesis protein TsaB
MAAAAGADPSSRRLVAAAIDAKKDELYVAVYDADRVLLPPCHVPRHAAAERVLDVLAGRPFVSIADAEDIAGWATAAERALVAPPSAAWVGRLAAAQAERGEPSDAAEVVPLYVRAPDAIVQSGAMGLRIA